MSITTASPATRARATGTLAPRSTGSLPPPISLTIAQLRELESELRRELGALDRRLASERQAESAESPVVDAPGSTATRRASDTGARRDLVAAALSRLAAGEYGVCSRCSEPIPYGRLLVMPEATHCLACSGRL
jgi:DnaK suppressor protein